MMFASGIYALTNLSTTGKSFSTSGVNIEIEEFTLNSENEEVRFNSDEPIPVMPGQEVNLIAKVNNLGANCYVRVKTILERNSQDISSNILGMPSEWKKQGEYYYYSAEVASKNIIEIFKNIKIPEEISNSEDEIKLRIIAEAVQAKNFDQDLALEDPWHGIEIAECIDSSYTIDDDESTNKMTIKYENNANDDIKIADKFLEDFKGIMPGDKITENVVIKNTNENEAEYFVGIEAENLTDKEKELLEKITLRILNGSGQVVYDGSLLKLNNLSLGKYESGSGDNLTFEINVPSELGNEFAILNPNITWKFTADYKAGQNIKKTGNPKTGDSGVDMFLTLFFLSTVGLIVVIVLEFREKRRKK